MKRIEASMVKRAAVEAYKRRQEEARMAALRAQYYDRLSSMYTAPQPTSYRTTYSTASMSPYERYRLMKQ